MVFPKEVKKTSSMTEAGTERPGRFRDFIPFSEERNFVKEQKRSAIERTTWGRDRLEGSILGGQRKGVGEKGLKVF